MSKTTPEDLAKKRSDEKMLVSEMIALYCRKQHHTLRGSLCPECQQLHDYALARIELRVMFEDLISRIDSMEIVGEVDYLRSNFVHGIVMIGAMVVLGHADTTTEKVIGFLAVLMGAGNAAGGYVVTERMLEMFKPSQKAAPKQLEGDK